MAPAPSSRAVRVLLYGDRRDAYAVKFQATADCELLHCPDAGSLQSAIASRAGDVVVVCDATLPEPALAFTPRPPVIWIAEAVDIESADVLLPPAVSDFELSACIELLGRRHQLLDDLDRLSARLQEAFASFNWRGQSRWHGHHELLAMAYSDSLTGLFSRRHFERALRYEVEIAQSGGRPLCLLLIDLDRFKPVNDQRGHQVGDAVLIEVARRLKLCVRNTDVVCRYGGDEFAIIAPGTPVSAALRMADRLRLAVAGAPYPGDGVTIRLGCSIGIAVVSEGGTPDELVRSADRALFEAKQLGGDRVCVHQASK